MPSLKDIKRRIGSVKNTQKITRAMKMVAAAKLRRAQETILRARPYASYMNRLASGLALRADAGSHPLLRREGGNRVRLVVISSDRGLCGGFNHSLVGAALEQLRTTFAGKEVELVIVGRKGIDILKRRPVTIAQTYTGIYDMDSMRASSTVLNPLVEQFSNGEIDEVHVLYNEFKSAISQKVVCERFLPFQPDDDHGAVAVDYLYEPSVGAVLEQFLMRHLQVQMHRVLHESAASEQGARMTAMDSATNNAGDMIGRLTLHYNRARQAAITKELIEVISGSEAL
jgi:F-type H+-transporting ATPase subunit gamma